MIRLKQLKAVATSAADTFPDVAPKFPQELKNVERWIVRTVDKRPHSALEDHENLGGTVDAGDKYQAFLSKFGIYDSKNN
jgi:hypothetical protein